MYCVFVFVFALLCLAPCPGRGRGGAVCLDYLTNYTDWNFHDPDRDAQGGCRLDTSFAVLFISSPSALAHFHSEGDLLSSHYIRCPSVTPSVKHYVVSASPPRTLISEF